MMLVDSKDNILISDAGEPLLCDFGVARMVEATASLAIGNSTSTLCGTARFMARELLDPPDTGSSPYTRESDMWAFGMTVVVSFPRFAI